MKQRHLIVGYTTKDGGREFTTVKGYILSEGSACPSYLDIRKDCLEWANSDGESFNYCQINFMQFVDKVDYNSFFDI